VKVLGIDPGLHGALALFDDANGDLTVWDMPVFNIGKSPAKKYVIDESGLARLIDSIAAEVSEAWLELVGSRPGEGHVGAFTFGKGYGMLRGVLAANFITIRDVTPASWKAAMAVKGGKDVSRRVASNLMPRHAWNWPLVKHDGRAEAALIAKFGALRGRA
jgi:hypothetical protein